MSAPWAKIWWTWYTSRSHLGLSGIALALGPPLMLICRDSAKRHSDASGDASRDGSGDSSSDEVLIVDAHGKPLSAQMLAHIVRFDVGQVVDALADLVRCGTLSVNKDGVYTFPKFWKYQETAAASRTRKYRGSMKRHSDASRDASRDASGDGKRLEVRGKREEKEKERALERLGRTPSVLPPPPEAPSEPANDLDRRHYDCGPPAGVQDRRGASRDEDASGLHVTEFGFRLSAACDKRDTDAPVLGRQQQFAIAKRILGNARRRGVTFAVACDEMIAQAFDDVAASDGRLALALALGSAEPGKPKEARSGGRQGRHAPSRAAGAEAWESIDDGFGEGGSK